MKKTTFKLFATIIAALLVAASFTGKVHASETQTYTDEIPPLSYTDFIGKTLGVSLGGLSENVAIEVLDAVPAYYNDLSAGIEDIRKGRIDGHVTDYSTLRTVAAIPENADLVLIEIPRELFSAPMGAISMDQDIIDRFNVFLSAIKADGTLTEMQERWITGSPDLDAPMPVTPLTGESGTLRIATCGERPPFSFRGEGGELKGYSIELALRFAAHEGMDVSFSDMVFSEMIPAVVSGRADLALSNISITEERAKSVTFTDSIYDDYFGILALKQTGANAAGASDYTLFAGKQVGVAVGTVFEGVTRDIVGAEAMLYNDISAGLADLRNGRIAGYMHDLSTVRMMMEEPGNEDLTYYDIPLELFSSPMGAISINQDIIDRFNAFLAEIELDGTLAEMQNLWLLTAVDLNSPMPEIPLTGENGVLRVSLTSLSPPYTYVGARDELKGYCVELAYRFAAREGMSIEFYPVGFSAFMEHVVSGKSDICIDAITVTEERKQSVLFTDPIFIDGAGIIALYTDSIPETGSASTAPAGEDGGGFIDWIKTGIERNLITDARWRLIVDGLGVTIIISVLAQLFGTITGCFVCYLLMRRNKAASLVGRLYCGLIHGTPAVVLLMITYYIIFGNTTISNVLVAVAAFTLVVGAGVGQTLKGVIETVDIVEIEAARSIGFSSFKAFTAVTLPQAVKRAMPSYTNGFVELVKATAIVGYIAIQDLTRAGDIIRSRTYDAYFPLILVAVIYLIVTTICVQIFKLIIRKLNNGGDAQ